jgi:LysM repeat protein
MGIKGFRYTYKGKSPLLAGRTSSFRKRGGAGTVLKFAVFLAFAGALCLSAAYLWLELFRKHPELRGQSAEGAAPAGPSFWERVFWGGSSSAAKKTMKPREFPQDELKKLADVRVKAQSALESGKYKTARLLSNKVISSGLPMSHPLWRSAAETLGKSNIALLFSELSTPEKDIYVVKAGDTLPKIASAFGDTAETVKRGNKALAGGAPLFKGQKLLIHNGKWSVKVFKSEGLLNLMDGDRLFKSYSAGFGVKNTPSGEFETTETRGGSKGQPLWAGLKPAGQTRGQVPADFGILASNERGPVARVSRTDDSVRLESNDAGELCSILPPGSKVTIED